MAHLLNYINGSRDIPLEHKADTLKMACSCLGLGIKSQDIIKRLNGNFGISIPLRDLDTSSKATPSKPLVALSNERRVVQVG